MVKNQRKAYTAGLWTILLLLAAWAYWPGLQGPLLLDDGENLQVLEQIEDNPTFATDIVLGNISGPMGRPVSMSSFALEKLFLDRGVAGQKQINLLIHLLNATLVLFLLGLMLGARGVSLPFGQSPLLAALWLMAPLLLSTTLYVVQRMTLLAACFSLFCMVFYCLARNRQIAGGRPAALFVACLVCVPLAVLSKENGLLVLPMLGAIELFVFRAAAPVARHRRLLVRLHTGLWLAAAAGSIGVLLLAPELLLGGYADRDFTLMERVLSQFRFLWYYLIQFLSPDVHLLGVYHDDVIVSTSLFDPLSTVFSLLAWLLVAAGIIWSALKKKAMLLALGFSLYLLGQAMESTILPLEMYFEHRSYLPSVGFLVALAGLLVAVQQRHVYLGRWLTLLLVILVGRNALLLGSQAVLWSDNNLLQVEAANYHPDSPRALYGLAQVYARYGALDHALLLVRRAAELEDSAVLREALIEAIYHCYASASLPASHWRAMQVTPEQLYRGDFSNQFSLLISLVTNGSCDSVDASALAADLRTLLDTEQGFLSTPRMLGSLMFLENYLGNYPAALDYADQLHLAEPEEMIALQFQLYLSTVLELPQRRQQALNTLMSMRDRGVLSRQEQYNLELFLDE